MKIVTPTFVNFNIADHLTLFYVGELESIIKIKYNETQQELAHCKQNAQKPYYI